MLAKSPGFSFAIAALLAIGIGANTVGALEHRIQESYFGDTLGEVIIAAFSNLRNGLHR